MKKFILKSIIMFLMVALVSQAAGAQNVNTTVSTNDFQACKAYLSEHPTDTIVSKLEAPELMVAEEDGQVAGLAVAKGDTLSLVGYSVFVKDGKVMRRADYVKTVRVQGETLYTVDFSEADALDRKAVETMFQYKITEGHRRDVEGYQLSTAINSPDGKAIKKAADKDGWGIQAEASYQLAEHCTAFTGSGGLSYTGRWWQVDLMGGATRTFYNDNATEENVGAKYWALDVETAIWLQPFKFGKYDCDRLFFGAGPGFEWYRTDSRETEIGIFNSEGNYIYLHAGIKYVHRFFATGNSVYLKVQCRQKKSVFQNEDAKVRYAIVASLGVELGSLGKIFDFRNKISH